MIKIRLKSICNDYRYDFEPTLIDSYRLGFLSREKVLFYFPDFDFIRSNQAVDRNIKGYILNDNERIELDSSNYLEELSKLEEKFLSDLNTTTQYEHDSFNYYSKVHNDSFFSSPHDNILLFKNQQTKIMILTDVVLYNFHDISGPVKTIEFTSNTRRLVIKSPNEKQIKQILNNYFKLKENVKSDNIVSSKTSNS